MRCVLAATSVDWGHWWLRLMSVHGEVVLLLFIVVAAMGFCIWLGS